MRKSNRLHEKARRKRVRGKMIFTLQKSIALRQVAPAISVHYAWLRVIDNRRNPSKVLLSVDIPCRANLYKLVNDLYFLNNDKRIDNTTVEIEEDDVSILQMFFTFRKHYGHWKEGLQIIEEKGREEARKWLMEKAQILGLLKAMMPKEES